MGHLAVPAGKAENRVGLGDGKPPLDIVDRSPLDLARLNMAAVELALEPAELGLGEIAHRTRTAMCISPLMRMDPGMTSPRFSTWIRPTRSSRGGWGRKNSSGIFSWSVTSRRGGPCRSDKVKSSVWILPMSALVMAQQASSRFRSNRSFSLRKARLHVLDPLLKRPDEDLILKARADDGLDEFGEVGDALQRVLKGLFVDIPDRGL